MGSTIADTNSATDLYAINSYMSRLNYSYDDRYYFSASYRMDAYSPYLIKECGLTGMIGKGKRGPEVIAAMKEHGAVYFGAIGGCGALLSKCIKKAEVIAYDDLGAEAIRRLEVENFPVVVIIDSEGNNLYEMGRKAYLEQV